jgi:toxin ParE1/3/4
LQLRFTPSGREQFLAAVVYIQADDPAAAKRFRIRVEKVLRRLERFPQSGRVIPEFHELPHREVIVAPYRFFYKW